MVTLRRTWRLFWSWTLVWATVVVAAADGSTPPAAVAAGLAVAACCLPWPLLRIPFAVAAGVAGAVALGVAVVPALAGPPVFGTTAAVAALLVVAGSVAWRVPAAPAAWLVALVGLAAVFTAARWGVPVAGGVAVLLAGALAGAVGRRVRAQQARQAAVAEQLAAIVAEARAAEGDVSEALDRIEDAGRRALAQLGSRPTPSTGRARSTVS